MRRAHFGIARRCVRLIAATAPLLISLPGLAQDIEPRRWSHLPTGGNFVGAVYAYTTGEIVLDPSLRVEDAEFSLQTVAVRYTHSFEAFGKSARIELTQPYQSGEWSGLIDGIPASTAREGFSDTMVRFAVNLVGAPPLSGPDFAEYRARTKTETIVGAALSVQLPTGYYLEDRRINLGNNRFAIRPQFGVVHNRGKWSLELTAATWFFTDNSDFAGGHELEQRSLYTAEGHLIYSFRPGLWLATSIGYGGGGKSFIDKVSSDDPKDFLGWGVSFGFPINRHLGIKAGYIGSRAVARTGVDSDTLTVGCAIAW